jgi:cytochrome bd-type quinol oxidase subunit 2
MARVYQFSAYDGNLALKVSPTLWLVVIFLLRPYVIMVLSFANRRDPMALIEMFYADRLPMVVASIAALPVILFLVAYIKRSKAENVSWARRLWHRGRALLMVSAVLNVFVVFFPYLVDPHHQMTIVGVTQLLTTLFVVLFLARSQRVKDTFADYPMPPGPGSS